MLCAALVAGAGLLACDLERDARAEEPDAIRERTSIVAMARLEPNGRVVKVSAATDDIIRKIEVSDGAEVKEGQILVTLDGFALRQRSAAPIAQIEGRRARKSSLGTEHEDQAGDRSEAAGRNSSQQFLRSAVRLLIYNAQGNHRAEFLGRRCGAQIQLLVPGQR